jgi:two-component system sensor histidine kinase YesM
MRKRRPFISISSKLIFIFSCIIIVPVTVMSINSYVSSQRLLERKYTDLLLDIAKQSNIRISEYLKEIEKITLVSSYGMNRYSSLVYQEEYPIQDFLHYSNDESENITYRVLMNYILMKDRLFSIYIYSLNGGRDMFVHSTEPIDYSYRPLQEPWFREFLASDRKVVILDPQVDKQIRNKNKYAVLHARKVFDMSNGRLLGVMVASIDINFIGLFTNRLQEGLRTNFTIVDQHNRIIYHANSQLIGRSFQDIMPFRDEKGITQAWGEDYLVVRSPFEELPWTTYLYTPLSEISAEGAILKQNMFILAGLILVFASFTSIFLSTVIARPIKKLMRNITLVEKGLFDNLPVIDSNDEIGELSRRFNRMSSELKQLVSRIQKEEKEKAMAEIRALQSQINPHFLYNTLGSVKWIASMQKADKIVEMTEALISILRYTAKLESSMVTLREEIDNIRNYIIIQNVRYYNRIQLQIQVDDSLLDNRMPKLILQPIVENAIFHGFAELEDEGIITVRAHRYDEGIQIEISDNGAGIDPATAEWLNRELRSAENIQTSGIGLPNVQRRIQLHYGDRYGIGFHSAQGQGTTFVITLPDIQD